MADQIVIKKNFKYRLYPTSAQIAALDDQLAEGCRLYNAAVQELGAVKVNLHRPIKGRIKTDAVKREAGRWCAEFSVECEAQVLPASSEKAGLDVGLSAFATLSDGTEIENPRYYKETQAKLRRAQRKVARRKRGGNNRKKAVRDLQRAHAHVRNQREDFAHKVARRLVLLFGLIVVEKLNVKGLAAGILAKPVNDAGWSSFITNLTYKAAEPGRELVKVDPRGTSQRCVCGAPNPKTLSQRWRHCESWGLSVPCDHASALEILRLGLSLLGGAWPVAASVPNEAALL